MLKKKRAIIIRGIICLAFCFLFISCKDSQGGETRKTGKREESDIIKKDITLRADLYVDSLLTTMTLEEIAGQCFMPSIYSNADSLNVLLLKKYIEDYHIGGVLLLKGDKNGVIEISKIGNSTKIPLFISIDAEWGLGMRLADAKIYPKNGNIDINSEETELYDYGNRVANECREIGINMVLGPVIDIASTTGGIIGKRSFSSDPQLVADFGVAYAKGLESGGVISVAKHFPGHGGIETDSHKHTVTINKNITMLDTVDLKPFRSYINAGLTGIMAGHIQSKALDPNGTAASVSMDMLTSLLREELEFKGLVLTDAFNMGGADGFSASDALIAGADIILCPSDVGKEYNELMKNVQMGNIDVSIIKTRCKRILFTKYLFGII